jgi:hypothetical protein
MSSSDAVHYGRIAFRVGQWPLSVRLEAPPSNEALSVANIEVGISMLGAGIAVQRMSDANGRLEVTSLPERTVAFECVVVSGGKYYYGDATLTHSRPRSITLVLRNVEDLKTAWRRCGSTSPRRQTRSRWSARSSHLRLAKRTARESSWRQRSGDRTITMSTTVDAQITPVDRQWGPTRRFASR